MDSEITLRMENWRGGDRDETQNGAHVMRRKGCAMQNKGITLRQNAIFSDPHLIQNHTLFKTRMK